MDADSGPRQRALSLARELGFLRTPRWVAITVLLAALIPAFWHLSTWQFHRLDDKRSTNAAVAAAVNAAARPLGEVLARSTRPGRIVADWTPAAVEGTWLPRSTVFARRHWREDRMGFYVVSLFQPVSGGVLTVVRGFTPAQRSATATPDLASPPAGRVRLEGWLRLPERVDTRVVPPGQVNAVNNDALGNTSASTTTMWLLVNHSATTRDSLVASEEPRLLDLSPPSPSEGPHHSYAWQWRAFAVLVVGGWVSLVRTEVRQRRREESAGQTEVSSA